MYFRRNSGSPPELACAHEPGVALVLHGERGEHLERRGDHAALVRGAVLEHRDALLLQLQARLLRDEEVGAFHDPAERGTSLRVEQRPPVREVDRLRPAAAGHEEVRPAAGVEVEGIAEPGARGDHRAVAQSLVAIADAHGEPLRSEPGLVEGPGVEARAGEPRELGPVEPVGVPDHAAAIDHGDGAVTGDQDFVRAEVAVGPARLHLGDVLLAHAELAQDAEHVPVHALGGHPVFLVRNAAQRRLLARGEGLPVPVAPVARVQRGPAHQVRRALVGPEEEDLLGPADHGRRVRRREQVEHCIDVALERVLRLRGRSARGGQYHALGPALGNVLVLAVLGEGEVVALLEQRVGIAGVVVAGGRPHDADAAPGDVREAHVEAVEVAADHEEQAERQDLRARLDQEPARQAEARGEARGQEHVRALDRVDELQGPAHHGRFVAGRPGTRGRFKARPGLVAAAARDRRVEPLAEHGKEVARVVRTVAQHLLHERHRERVAVDAGLQGLEDGREIAFTAEALGEQREVGIAHADELVYEQGRRVGEGALRRGEGAGLHEVAQPLGGVEAHLDEVRDEVDGELLPGVQRRHHDRALAAEGDRVLAGHLDARPGHRAADVREEVDDGAAREADHDPVLAGLLLERARRHDAAPGEHRGAHLLVAPSRLGLGGREEAPGRGPRELVALPRGGLLDDVQQQVRVRRVDGHVAQAPVGGEGALDLLLDLEAAPAVHPVHPRALARHHGHLHALVALGAAPEHLPGPVGEDLGGDHLRGRVGEIVRRGSAGPRATTSSPAGSVPRAGRRDGRRRPRACAGTRRCARAAAGRVPCAAR